MSTRHIPAGVRPGRLAVPVAIAVLMAAVIASCARQQPERPLPTAVDSVRGAFQSQRSGFMVTVAGRVTRILADDNEGSRHQRFIIEIGGSHTLLVSHNIDVAPRAPIARDDSVTVRGQYEWNLQGGVLHWTHRDPAGSRPGGWIRHGRAEYR